MNLVNIIDYKCFVILGLIFVYMFVMCIKKNLCFGVYNLVWYLKVLYIICILYKLLVFICIFIGDILLFVNKILLFIFYCCMVVICIYMIEYVIIKVLVILILWFINFVFGNMLYILKYILICVVCLLYYVDDDNIYV